MNDTATFRLTSLAGSPFHRALDVATAALGLRSRDDVDAMLREAVELARARAGLIRVAIYVRDPTSEHIMLRGSWGTDSQGQTVSEHALSHELSDVDALKLLRMQATHPPCLCRPRALQYSIEDGRSAVIGAGWIMATPLIADGHLIGVMYNDSAPTGAPPDPAKQVAAAALCRMTAIEYAARMGAIPWPPIALALRRSALAERIVRAIEKDPTRAGKDLAKELGVSAAFVAREFKREMRMSLVEYRNRIRIERFHALREQGARHSLRRAALECGFGSYAQFNRVYTRLMGQRPGALDVTATARDRPPDLVRPSVQPYMQWPAPDP